MENRAEPKSLHYLLDVALVLHPVSNVWFQALHGFPSYVHLKGLASTALK